MLPTSVWGSVVTCRVSRRGQVTPRDRPGPGLGLGVSPSPQPAQDVGTNLGALDSDPHRPAPPTQRLRPTPEGGMATSSQPLEPALPCLPLRSLQPRLCTIARVWKVLPSFPMGRPTGCPGRAACDKGPSALPPREGSAPGSQLRCGVWALPGVPAPLDHIPGLPAQYAPAPPTCRGICVALQGWRQLHCAHSRPGPCRQRVRRVRAPSGHHAGSSPSRPPAPAPDTGPGTGPRPDTHACLTLRVFYKERGPRVPRRTRVPEPDSECTGLWGPSRPQSREWAQVTRTGWTRMLIPREGLPLRGDLAPNPGRTAHLSPGAGTLCAHAPSRRFQRGPPTSFLADVPSRATEPWSRHTCQSSSGLQPTASPPRPPASPPQGCPAPPRPPSPPSPAQALSAPPRPPEPL